jgi:hypothetical protein
MHFFIIFCIIRFSVILEGKKAIYSGATFFLEFNVTDMASMVPSSQDLTQAVVPPSADDADDDADDEGVPNEGVPDEASNEAAEHRRRVISPSGQVIVEISTAMNDTGAPKSPHQQIVDAAPGASPEARRRWCKQCGSINLRLATRKNGNVSDVCSDHDEQNTSDSSSGTSSSESDSSDSSNFTSDSADDEDSSSESDDDDDDDNNPFAKKKQGGGAAAIGSKRRASGGGGDTKKKKKKRRKKKSANNPWGQDKASSSSSKPSPLSRLTAGRRWTVHLKQKFWGGRYGGPRKSFRGRVDKITSKQITMRNTVAGATSVSPQGTLVLDIKSGAVISTTIDPTTSQGKAVSISIRDVEENTWVVYKVNN